VASRPFEMLINVLSHANRASLGQSGRAGEVGFAAASATGSIQRAEPNFNYIPDTMPLPKRNKEEVRKWFFGAAGESFMLGTRAGNLAWNAGDLLAHRVQRHSAAQ
jgi:hypothetical protein